MKYLAVFKKLVSAVTVFVLFMLASPAFAAGFEPVNKLLNALIVGLHSIAIATATLAGLYVAFKVLWRKEALSEFSNVIIGSCIIVGIAELVAYIIPA